MSNTKPLKKKVSITLDENVVDKIQILSEMDDRNFSQYINMVLRKHIQYTLKEDSPQYENTADSP